MAIAWWMDTGTHFKMEADIREKYGSQSTYWQRPKIRGNIPLGFSHVAPSVIIFGLATFLSLIAFALEMIPNYLSKKNKIKKNKIEKNRRRQMQGQLKRAKVQPRSTMKPPRTPKKSRA